MTFTVIIPARLASTRLPNKPLADLGGKPMVVRTAERAQQSGASRVIVATDHEAIVAACHAHGLEVCLTRADHPSGTDRIAEVAAQIGLPADAVVVNVQGDEPLIEPTLISATAALINADVPMATAAHPLTSMQEVLNPNVVKVVLARNGCALYFSRASIPWCRDGFAPYAAQNLATSAGMASSSTSAMATAAGVAYEPLRHIGLYAYRQDFLQQYPMLSVSPLEQIEALEQLRVLWHGIPIAVHITHESPAAGVDTPEDLRRVQALFGA